MKKKITALLAGIFALVITVQAQSPTVSITAGSATLCQCGTELYTNVSTNGPTSWTWYFPGGTPSTYYTTVSPGNPPAVTYCNAGLYSVICVVKNNSGKDSVTQSLVQVIAAPAVTINPPSGGICDTAGGQSFDTIYFAATTGSPAYTYSWAPAGSLSCSTCSNPHAYPSSTTVYTLTVTGAGGCVTTLTDTVTVGSITAKITGRDSICQGFVDTLIASGGAQNPSANTQYHWSPGGQTSPVIFVSPTVPTTYTCLVISGGGSCTSTAVFTVYPYPVPHFTLTPSLDSICYGTGFGPAIITASPGGNTYEYYWFGPYGVVDSNVFITKPPVTTTYTLVVKNKGCYFDSLVKVKVNYPPVVYLSGATNLCQGSTTIICATGGTSYHWSTGGSTSCIDVKPPASITYTVKVADGACYKDTTFTIIVDQMPTVKFSGDTSICVGDSTTVYVSGGLSYAWTNGNTTDSIHQVYADTGKFSYFVTVTSGACSKDSDKITVKVYPHPKPVIYPIDTCVCLFDSIQLTASGGDYYLWTPKNTGLNHYKFYGDTDRNMASPATNTTYNVNVCTWGCCRDTSVNVCVRPNVLGAKVCCTDTVQGGTPVQLSATFDNGPYIIEGWTPSSGLSCSTCANPIATDYTTTTYVVQIGDVASPGCFVLDSVTIDIFNCNVFVPNIFSPGQRVNNILKVRSLCLETMDFAVFDRWGNKLYETTNINDGWDGTYHGKAMDMGTYMWFLNGLEEDGTNISKSGNVTLLR